MRVRETAVVPVTVTVLGIPKTVGSSLTTTIIIPPPGVGLLDNSLNGVDFFLGRNVPGGRFQSARVGQDIRHLPPE